MIATGIPTPCRDRHVPAKPAPESRHQSRHDVAIAALARRGAQGYDQPGVKVAISRYAYDGELTASFGDGLFAVPIRALWETP